MAPVGRDPRVLRGERRLDARADRLLAVVQMAEPADRSGFVLVITRNLHAAHRVHGLEVLEELGLVRLGGGRGLVAQVGRVRARELDGDGRFGREGASRLGARGLSLIHI